MLLDQNDSDLPAKLQCLLEVISACLGVPTSRWYQWLAQVWATGNDIQQCELASHIATIYEKLVHTQMHASA